MNKKRNIIVRIIIFFVKVMNAVSGILLEKTFQDKKGFVLLYIKLKIKYYIFVRLLKKNITQESLFGFKVKFFDYWLFIYLFKEIFLNDCYYFYSKKDSPFIIDCGCNIGMSILYFKKLYPNARIIGFEPDLNTFKLLEENIKSNNLSNVELHNKAVHSTRGSLTFYFDSNVSGSLMMSTSRDRNLPESITVKSVILSDYIKTAVDYVKMDIEGAENAVIKEIVNHDKLKYIQEMAIEYHHHMNPDDDSMSKILSMLEKNRFGYQLHTLYKPMMNKRIFQDILIYSYKK